MGSSLVIDTFVDKESGEPRERIVCPSCEGDAPEDFRASRDRLFDRPGTYQVVRCKLCGMIYTNPRPTFEALGKHYPDKYACFATPESMQRGFRRWFFSSITRDTTLRRMRLIERYVGKLGATARACDVGCSHGDLLAALRDAYHYDVMGVELNPSMVARCAERGIKAVPGTLTQANLEAASFDLVTMTEYLEHEGDPRRVLEESRRITRAGGYLIVEIPLVSSLPARLFRDYWAQLDLPRHLMFFTQKTLQRMLHESGYEVVATQTLRGMLAPSLLNALGYDGMGELTARQLGAILLTETLMLPLQPFSREFLFVVARAVDIQAPNHLHPGSGHDGRFARGGSSCITHSLAPR